MSNHAQVLLDAVNRGLEADPPPRMPERRPEDYAPRQRRPQAVGGGGGRIDGGNTVVHAPTPAVIEGEVNGLITTAEKLGEAATSLGTEVGLILSQASNEGAAIIDKLRALTDDLRGTLEKVGDAKAELLRFNEALSAKLTAASELSRRLSAQADTMQREVAGIAG